MGATNVRHMTSQLAFNNWVLDHHFGNLQTHIDNNLADLQSDLASISHHAKNLALRAESEIPLANGSYHATSSASGSDPVISSHAPQVRKKKRSMKSPDLSNGSALPPMHERNAVGTLSQGRIGHVPRSDAGNDSPSA